MGRDVTDRTDMTRTRTRTRTRARFLAALAAMLLVTSPLLVGAGEEEAAEEEGAEERDGPLPPLPWDRPKQGEEKCFAEEITMLRDLRGRSVELDRREAALAEREVALTALEAEAAARLDELDAVRGEILELLGREQVATADRVRTLAKMVDTMKPREAATLLAGMERDVAILVLRKLKPKQAGKVLGSMPPEIAQEIGDRMTVLDDPRDGAADAGGND